ncbi:progestin and adipoQ receptor family member 6 isoform X6 [Sus scrofa]|uniref:progestin and adipoQ receptor family member 6 isoform X6 n=1 Tax=Sus scrofa TaxID=9823 RepID=UPI0006B18BC5|nr:progestin and adipoQ receptor family member 6 isoform X6 [Sus scrofa]
MRPRVCSTNTVGKVAAGRGAGLAGKLAWGGGGSVLFSLLPGSSTRPGGPAPPLVPRNVPGRGSSRDRRGSRAVATGGSTQVGPRGTGLRRDWDPKCLPGASTWRYRVTMLSLKLPQLLRVHQVPRVFWEDGIMSGYRHPTSSALDCVLSSFQMTNETVNIWTHFLPTWYFLWRLLALAGGPGFWSEPYHWPLLIFLLPACLYPFASCCAHTFSSMSPRARHICYFLDYAPAPRTPRLRLPLCRLLHAGLLAAQPPAPALCPHRRTQFLPVHRPLLLLPLGLCWGRGPSCGQEALSTSHCYHLFCALLTGFLFASHLPERLAPGRFDYIGHSHQLFHICAVLGTHFQLEAVLADMGSRRAWLATQDLPLGLMGTMATLGLVVAGNLLIITAFTASLFRAPSTCPLLQGGPLEEGTKAKLQ